MALDDKDRILKNIVVNAIIEGLKQKLIIMPKFIEKTLPDYKLVPKEVVYEVPVPKKVEKPYDVPVPVPKKVIVEIPHEVLNLIYKDKIVDVPKLKYFDLETFKPAEVERMRQLVELLPKVLEALDKIVKFVPKEVPYEVKVPKVKEEPYPVSVPEFKTEIVLRPHFQDVKILHPIIVEQIMTLDEWNALSKSEREKIGEIIKSQLKVKRHK